MPSISVLIFGAGGHAKVLIDTLHLLKINILGIMDSSPEQIGQSVLDVPILGCEDEILKQYSPTNIQLVNGIGSTISTAKREYIFNRHKNMGYHFLNVIHPSVYIGQNVMLGEGIQAMAGSIVQSGSHIGNNVIINTHATVDHDCFIGDHVHLAPSTTCCGAVTIGNRTQVGCGAIIIQNVKIGEQSLIAAGAVVIRDVTSHSKMAGIPARMMEEKT